MNGDPEMVNGNPSSPSKDSRNPRERTERALALAVVFFLVGVGSLAIMLAYGPRALLLGGICLVAGATIFGLLWGILTAIERWVN